MESKPTGMKKFVFDTADTENVSKLGVGEWSLNLNHQIGCSKVVVSNVIIPHTFYNINETNNEFIVIKNDLTQVTVKFPVQFMNANDISSTTIEGITITFDKKKFKFTFNRDLPLNSSVKFITGITFTTSHKVFGFESSTYYFEGSETKLEAPFVADFNSIPAIYIRCNQIHSKFIYNNNRTSILHRLIVDKPFGQLLTFQNNSTDMFVNQENIGYMQFSLTDNRGQHINLNGADWKLELLLID